jgi:hypothetical protein
MQTALPLDSVNASLAPMSAASSLSALAGDLVHALTAILRAVDYSQAIVAQHGS